MARSIWKGSIAFGLVNIPIEVYSATRDHRPKFRLLHAKDEEPVRYERVCQKEGKPVAWEDLVKGYEYARNQFVVLTKDDFKTAARCCASRRMILATPMRPESRIASRRSAYARSAPLPGVR